MLMYVCGVNYHVTFKPDNDSVLAMVYAASRLQQRLSFALDGEQQKCTESSQPALSLSELTRYTTPTAAAVQACH